MEILFIDDDAEEASAFKEAVMKRASGIQVSHISYCMEVFWLLKLKKHDVVFLRVDGESKNGIFFLQAIRSMKELGALPVIIYSTAMTDRYIDRCYKAKANYYLQKQESVTSTVDAFSKLLLTNLKKQQRIQKSLFIVQ
jgi:DNA-binding NarL/FixJ family response regulator